jgi:hypothetical protein
MGHVTSCGRRQQVILLVKGVQQLRIMCLTSEEKIQNSDLFPFDKAYLELREQSATVSPSSATQDSRWIS